MVIRTHLQRKARIWRDLFVVPNAHAPTATSRWIIVRGRGEVTPGFEPAEVLACQLVEGPAFNHRNDIADFPNLCLWKQSTALIFLGRHADCAMKRSGKTSLRGELRIERNLRERQFARRQFRHRVLQPDAAYVAVRRDTDRVRELTRKMKCAVTGDSSEIYERDLTLDVRFDIVKNTAEPSMIETVRAGVDGRACPAIAMLMNESGCKRQRGRFDVHAARGRLDLELRED